MAKDKIVIIGGKGTAVVVAEQIEDARVRFGSNIEVLGFAFDDPAFGKEINGYPILCRTYEAYERFKSFNDVFFIYQLYRSDLIKERIKLRDSFDIPVNRYYNFIHPSVMLSKSVKMGHGNTILANSVLNSNVLLGNFNTIHSNVLIAHDTTIGDSNFFAGHSCIGSNINIETGCFFGLNSSVKNFVKIEDYNLIGMGANVLNNFRENNVIVGNPAKIMRENYEE